MLPRLLSDAPPSVLVLGEPAESDEWRLQVCGQRFRIGAKSGGQDVDLLGLLNKKAKVLAVSSLQAASIKAVNLAGRFKVLTGDKFLTF